MTYQRKIATPPLPPNSRKVCPGTISKSSAPYGVVQPDVLIEVTTAESLRGNESKRFTFQAAKENTLIDLHTDERDLSPLPTPAANYLQH